MVPSRSGTAAYILLLAVGTIFVAEAALLAMLFLFSFILRMTLVVELGPAGTLFTPHACCTQLSLYNAATIGSLVFTAACGVATAARTYRRWGSTQ